jgi:hypothetical protein
MPRAFRWHSTQVVQCILLVGACFSCRMQEKQRSGAQGSETADTAEVTETLQRLLTASLATTTATFPESLLACSPEYAASSGLVLVDYKILRGAINGDSAVGIAEVVSVARDTEDSLPGRTARSVGVRRDTLEWSLIRNSNGRWGVCGYAKGAVDFIQLWGDSSVDWRPKGETMAHLRSLVDSARRAQN